MKFYTYRKAALAAKKAWQHLGFKKGHGYFLKGNRPPVAQGEAKNQAPFNRPVVAPAPFIMYDSVNLGHIPKDAVAVAGYTSGLWPTYGQLANLFPKAKHLSIAVNAAHDAMCLDVEKGDATPAQAPAWVKRQIARGLKRPVIYCSVSDAKGVLDSLRVAGIPRSAIRLWTAHYTFKVHRCGPSCGFGFMGIADATQYTDKALGRSLDASICAPDFL